MANKHAGICPYCGDNVTPVLIEENNIRRDVCKCPSCEKQLLICRTPGCQNYTKGGEIYDDELCPSCTSSKPLAWVKFSNGVQWLQLQR